MEFPGMPGKSLIGMSFGGRDFQTVESKHRFSIQIDRFS